MTELNVKNIKVVGEGSSHGGEYEKIKVTGKGNILGDVKAKEARITGECNIKGNADMAHYSLTGKGMIDGELACEEMKVTGDLMVNGAIRGTNFKMRGFVTSKGDVDLEKMILKGGFHINGLLNVGELSVHLQIADSKVREIGGETLTIKGRSLFNKPYRLEAETIEGDNVYVEYTTASIVRGNHVEIGPGCEIKQAEYRTTYKCKEKDGINIANVNQI